MRSWALVLAPLLWLGCGDGGAGTVAGPAMDASAADAPGTLDAQPPNDAAVQDGFDGAADVSGEAGDSGTDAPKPLQCSGSAHPGPSSPSTSKIPAEYVARSYAEAFGRLPDQGGWNHYLDYFKTHDCSAETLQTVTDFFKSSEFLARPYSNSQRLLALFRGALGREPTQTDFDKHLPALKANPDAWCDTVDQVEAMDEYAWMAKDFVCDPATANFHRESAFPPLEIAGSWSQGGLKGKLDQAGDGGTVALPESTLVLLTSTLEVPAGVTLTTEGLSGLAGRHAYARMARLVRAAGFAGPLVRVHPGATLDHMWLDGRRSKYDGQHPTEQNVFVQASAGKPSRVQFIRSDNPLGPQNIRFDGSTAASGCDAGNVASDNLVINWSNDNRLPGPVWSDGIFTLCESSIITRNEILDASDVALIAFFSENTAPQHSKITENKVLNAGNDAFAALGTDPFHGCGGATCDYSGLHFDGNTIWTGPNTRYVIGLGAGTRAWSFINPHGNGKGAAYSNNTSGESRVRVQIAIYISGMLSADFTGNWDPNKIDYVSEPAIPPNTCGIGATLANTPQYASGNLQGAVSANRDDCI
jgi:hypothetical protein